MILELIDGGIEEIYSDSYGWSGCETCDYGSCYGYEFDVMMTTGRVTIKADQEYESPVSEGFMMELLLPNASKIEQLTEKQFFEWLKSEVPNKIAEDNYGWRNQNIEIEWMDV